MPSGPFPNQRGGRFDSWGGDAAVRWERRAVVSLIVVVLLWLGDTDNSAGRVSPSGQIE
jgi:hypothetical protein